MPAIAENSTIAEHIRLRRPRNQPPISYSDPTTPHIPSLIQSTRCKSSISSLLFSTFSTATTSATANDNTDTAVAANNSNRKKNFTTSTFRGLGCAASPQVSVPAVIRTSADWQAKKVRKKKQKKKSKTHQHQAVAMDTPPPPPPPPPPPLLPSHPPPLSLQPSGPPSLHPQPSLPSQPSLLPQPLPPPQPSLQSSSPKLAYQPLVPHEYCSTPSGNQLVQMAGNTPHGVHIDATIKNDMFPQQSPCFVQSGVCSSREPSGFNSSRPLEYGHNDVYLNPQSSQPNQQFQPGNTTFAQRPLHPAPPPQTPSSHFSYTKPTIQPHPQHPYPRPYSLPSLPDGRRRFVADEQWRMPSSEFTDNQRGVWMSGGRTPSCSGPPFVQEGYFRPPIERPSANNMGFQLSTPNTLPAGAPIPGHGVSQMLPCRPDISAINCWRPA